MEQRSFLILFVIAIALSTHCTGCLMAPGTITGHRVPSGRLSFPPLAVGICEAIPNEWTVMLRSPKFSWRMSEVSYETFTRCCILLQYIFAMSAKQHTVQRREANPDVNYDDDVMADAAPDDEEALNDADKGDDEDSEDDMINATIESKGQALPVKIGQSVRLPCAVKGETVLQWKKDENVYFLGSVKPPGTPAKVTLDNNDIIIQGIEDSDFGVYRCEIPGTSNFIEYTLYKEEPAFITSLNATNGGIVKEGMDVEITCSTKGRPPPTLIWSKQALSGENVRLTERDAEFIHDKIIIRKIKQSQSGNYICYAENRVGAKPDARRIHITVLGAPFVHVHKQVINTRPNVEAILQCTAYEQPESIIRWYKDGKPVEDVENIFTIHNEGQQSNLTIVPRIDKDFGTYSCIAENAYGKHEKAVKLVQEPIVEDLEVDGPKLTWTIHSHLPLREIELQVKSYNGTEWRAVSVPIPSENSKHIYHVTHEIKDLNSGMYVANVRAKNDHDWSELTQSVITEIAPEPASVIRASVMGAGASAIRPTTVLLSSAIMYILIRFI